MQVRRTSALGPDGGWSSIALHLAPAEGGKEGFYLTLFPDNRASAVVFLSPRQLQEVLDIAEDQGKGDQAAWDYVAKIPLEPLLPSRSLGIRLRWLLTDSAAAIRQQVREQLDRRPPPPTPTEGDEVEPADATEAPAPAIKPWQIS
jgi:hypothetical protein